MTSSSTCLPAAVGGNHAVDTATSMARTSVRQAQGDRSLGGSRSMFSDQAVPESQVVPPKNGPVPPACERLPVKKRPASTSSSLMSKSRPSFVHCSENLRPYVRQLQDAPLGLHLFVQGDQFSQGLRGKEIDRREISTGPCCVSPRRPGETLPRPIPGCSCPPESSGRETDDRHLADLCYVQSSISGHDPAAPRDNRGKWVRPHGNCSRARGSTVHVFGPLLGSHVA